MESPVGNCNFSYFDVNVFDDSSRLTAPEYLNFYIGIGRYRGVNEDDDDVG